MHLNRDCFLKKFKISCSVSTVHLGVVELHAYLKFGLEPSPFAVSAPGDERVVPPARKLIDNPIQFRV